MKRDQKIKTVSQILLDRENALKGRLALIKARIHKMDGHIFGWYQPTHEETILKIQLNELQTIKNKLTYEK